jgi:hypothetical protein
MEELGCYYGFVVNNSLEFLMSFSPEVRDGAASCALTPMKNGKSFTN